jgi:hypothetical protein
MAPTVASFTSTCALLTLWMTSFIGKKILSLSQESTKAYVIVCEGEPMARGRRAEDQTTLEMALVGYQIERQKIEDKIREIQARLGGGRGPAGATPGVKKSAGTKRVLSPAARRRIAAAQKKRWAEHRKRLAQASKQG